MASRRDWLAAGLAILAEQGAPGLTIEQLTGRLGLSKGSFYHHFAGMAGFKTALLAHFESEHTTRYIDLVEQEPSAPPMAKLRRLLDLILAEDRGPDVEIAVRAWAQQDGEARDMQERVDRARVGYVRSLWEGVSDDPDEAARISQLLYVILIGAGHVIPPIPRLELRRLYEVALRLAPSETRTI